MARRPLARPLAPPVPVLLRAHHQHAHTHTANPPPPPPHPPHTTGRRNGFISTGSFAAWRGAARAIACVRAAQSLRNEGGRGEAADFANHTAVVAATAAATPLATVVGSTLAAIMALGLVERWGFVDAGEQDGDGQTRTRCEGGEGG